MSNVAEVTEANFQAEVLEADKLTLVDFWAPWCGPCRQVAPVVEELAGEMSDKLKFTKLNVDEAPAISASYHVTGIPMLGFFKNGELVHAVVGARPKSALKAEIAEALAR